jgi:hypothetical protein
MAKGWERRQVLKTIEIDPIATMDFHRRFAPLPRLQALLSAQTLFSKAARIPTAANGVNNSAP